MAAIAYVGVHHSIYGKPFLAARDRSQIIPAKQVNILNGFVFREEDDGERDLSGTITGTALVGGVALAGAKIHLYARNNGERIQSAITDSSGNYTFRGIDKSFAAGSYYIVGLYPDGSTVARVLDHKTPA